MSAFAVNEGTNSPLGSVDADVALTSFLDINSSVERDIWFRKFV